MYQLEIDGKMVKGEIEGYSNALEWKDVAISTGVRLVKILYADSYQHIVSEWEGV